MSTQAGRAGSNQYTKNDTCLPAPAVLPADLLAQTEHNSKSKRCSEVWGGKCQILVGSPGWAHGGVPGSDGGHPTGQAKLAAAATPRTIPAVLETLSHDRSVQIRKRVARNPSTPQRALRELGQEQYEGIRGGVALNPACPPSLLSYLSEDRSYIVRRDVARNPTCPPAMLETLSADKRTEVRQRVARHPACPTATLEHLFETDPSVSSALATNRSCPPYILWRLSRYSGALIRRAVARNPSCPRVALEQMLHNSELPVIRNIAAHHPNLPKATLAMWQLAQSDV